MRAPGEMQRAIGWSQRRQRDSRLGEGASPAAIRSKPRPGGAAEREDGGVGRDLKRCARGVAEFQPAPLSEADEIMPHLEDHALSAEPCEERAQQGRSLEAFGKDPAARADKSLLAEPGAELAQVLRREGAQMRLEPRRGRAIARQERIERLAMGEVQPAAPGHQEFARRTGHMIENLDARAGARERLGRGEASGSGAEDGAIGSGDGRILLSSGPGASLSLPFPALRGEGRGKGRWRVPAKAPISAEALRLRAG